MTRPQFYDQLAFETPDQESLFGAPPVLDRAPLGAGNDQTATGPGLRAVPDPEETKESNDTEPALDPAPSLFDQGPELEPESLPVKVIRSSRRKKSSAARLVDGVVEVRIPDWMSEEEEAEVVADLVGKIEAARSVKESEYDLTERAEALSLHYGLPVATEIKWVTNQKSRWGSCSYNKGVIRISSRLTNAPEWVLDFVVLHELIHLEVHDHGPAFHDLMNQYPQVERAEGFLEAMSLGCADADFMAP